MVGGDSGKPFSQAETVPRCCTFNSNTFVAGDQKKAALRKHAAVYSRWSEQRRGSLSEAKDVHLCNAKDEDQR